MARESRYCQALGLVLGLVWAAAATPKPANNGLAASPRTRGTLVSFDMHAPTGRLALLYTSWRGGLWIDIIDIHTGSRIGSVSAQCAPTTPRFSPDGDTLLFVDTVGNILSLDLRTQTTKPILANKAFECVFPSWDPSGRSFVYYQRPRDRTAGMVFHLYRQDITSSRSEQLTDDPAALDVTPIWSPDGQHILFQRMSEAGPRRGRSTFMLTASTKEVCPILPDEPGDSVVSRYHWSPDGKRVLVLKRQRGQGETSGVNTLSLVRIEDRSVLWSCRHQDLENAAFLPDGSALLGVMTSGFLWIDAETGATTSRFDFGSIGPCKSEATGPVLGFEYGVHGVVFLSVNGTVYRVQPDGPCTPLVVSDPEPLPAFEQEEHRVDSQDGTQVPVKRFVPAKPKSEAVMLVIGGPGASVDPVTDPLLALLLDAGYEVVVPIYRGCGGYGPDYLTANRGEWGRADVLDVVAAGNDWRQHNGKERRLVLAGYSYGGYLALLSLARDGAPWDAGVTLWGMVSLQQPLLSMIEAGLPTEDNARERALAERSPLRQASQIRCPLLILHGALDGAADMNEVNTLRDSVVRSELIVYENDGHGLFLNRPDVLGRVIAFVSRLAAAPKNPSSLAGSHSE